jgi:tRNA threonylcarbamoyladenosine biosynthesis protein TsaB|nr:tRNA (adenosine(37)-N6)-threonylcarbamoyltransferase complex dimerization subunit type 1 TsaB [Kofleriaceae bacterium]
MKLLAIDTATRVVSVAVVDGDRAAVREHESRGTDLLVLVDAACRELGVAPAELEAVAVGAGPGSFTGLRIGMATAKGVAFAAGAPLWAVSSLAALVADDATGVAVAVLDARRGELYAGAYRDGVLVEPERVIAPGELAAWAGPDARFVGDALAVYPELAALAARWRHATPPARSIAQLALAGARADVVVHGAPAYLRPAEAELKYPDGVPGALRRR